MEKQPNDKSINANNLNPITINLSNISSKNPSEHSALQEVKLFLIRIPFFVRIITLASITLYIVSIFYESYVKILVNIPVYTIEHIYLWTILSSVFVNSKVYNLIYSLIIWIPEATNLEHSNGTVRYVLNFLSNSIIIQLIFLAISYPIAFIYKDILTDSNVGLMPVVLAEITILSMANPKNLVNFLCIPFYFPAKFYPFFVYIIFCLMNIFSFHFDVFGGFLYGFFYYKFLRNYFLISDEFIIKLESLFLCLKKLDCFLEVSKIKSSIRYQSFKLNNSQSSIDMPTTPNNITSIQKNKDNIKLFSINSDQSLSICKKDDTERNSEININTSTKHESSPKKNITTNLTIDIKK